MLNVIARWRIIRDNYVRNLKKQANSSRSSGSSSKKIKLYVYGDQLSFLGKNRELRNTDSNFENQSTTIFEPSSSNINETELDSSVNADDRGFPEVSRNKLSSLSEKITNKQMKPNMKQSLHDSIETH